VIPTPPTICKVDRYACRAAEAFELDPSCTLAGELEVRVGEGYDGFEGIGDRLEVHHGSQGGQHIFAAVRVANPALERYEVLEVRFTVVRADMDCPDVGDPCTRTLAERTLVMGQVDPLSADDDGAVEAYGVLLVLDQNPRTGDVYSATVRDPCGREGTASWRMP